MARPPKGPSTPKRKKKKNAKSSPKRPKSPRLMDLKRQAIWSTSGLMKKVNKDCTWMDVFKSLKTSHPNLFSRTDRPTVKRWSFTKDLSQKNRGTPVKGPEVEQEIIDRWADDTVDDVDKTTRNMAAHFTLQGMPMSHEYVRQTYIKHDLPGRMKLVIASEGWPIDY